MSVEIMLFADFCLQLNSCWAAWHMPKRLGDGSPAETMLMAPTSKDQSEVISARTGTVSINQV